MTAAASMRLIVLSTLLLAAVSAAADDLAGGSPASAGPPAAAAQSPITTAMWAMVGVAGLGAVAGGVFGTSALAEEDRFREHPSSQARDRGEDRALAADLCFGAAGVAAVAALVLALVPDGEGDAASLSSTSSGATLSIGF